MEVEARAATVVGKGEAQLRRKGGVSVRGVQAARGLSLDLLLYPSMVIGAAATMATQVLATLITRTKATLSNTSTIKIDPQTRLRAYLTPPLRRHPAEAVILSAPLIQ
jgi:hypothetical protein